MNAERNRNRQIDGLRAIAIGGVFIAHFLPSLGFLPWGQIGVRLFFVLSGFLITDILLDCRDKAGQSGGGRWWLLRQFYCRRFLRIFPLYYLVVGVAFLVDLEPVRNLIWWLVTYGLNVQISATQVWPEHVSHFWSLCVEEQFYLLWPPLLLFLPQRWLMPAFLATIAVAPLLRFFAVYWWENWVAVYVFPVVSFDALGAGALVALGMRRGLPDKIDRFLKTLALPLGLGVIALLEVTSRIKATNLPIAYAVFYDFGWTLIFCRVVQGGWTGFGGFAGRMCEWRPLTYIGEISYGLYVYHAFVPTLVLWLSDKVGWTPPKSQILRFWLFVVACLLLAALSWHCFEKPLNSLKRHFQYQGRFRKKTDPIPLDG